MMLSIRSKRWYVAIFRELPRTLTRKNEAVSTGQISVGVQDEDMNFAR